MWQPVFTTEMDAFVTTLHWLCTHPSHCASSQPSFWARISPVHFAFVQKYTRCSSDRPLDLHSLYTHRPTHQTCIIAHASQTAHNLTLNWCNKKSGCTWNDRFLPLTVCDITFFAQLLFKQAGWAHSMNAFLFTTTAPGRWDARVQEKF